MALVVDASQCLLAASRRAREALTGLELGRPVPRRILEGEGKRRPLVVPYELGGRPETLLYLNEPGDSTAYEELRAGFTAAVSHELRTPLARLLVLLETALLPGAETDELIEQAREEVQEIRELIDDVLFLGELETGREVVALGSTRALPVLREVAESLAERAERAGVTVTIDAAEDSEVPLRPRMLKVISENLLANSIRYAGTGATCTVSVARLGSEIVLRARDDGIGVADEDVPRLFERFYRADRARASRGTGLGLAIVKHIVTAAGGRVDAVGAPARGLQISCTFTRR